MLKTKFSIILVMVLLMTTSCMTTKLVAFYNSDSIAPHQATRITWLWGVLQSKDIPANCESNSICQVSTKTNAAYILISFATLGAVVPQKITWDCCQVDKGVEILK